MPKTKQGDCHFNLFYLIPKFVDSIYMHVHVFNMF